jgi:hypothetical protein
MNKENLKDMFINPFYAINILPSLCLEHEPTVSKEKWIEVNAKLIDEISKEEWLKRLLTILESGDQNSEISE